MLAFHTKREGAYTPLSPPWGAFDQRIERCLTERGIRIPLRERSVARVGITMFEDAFEYFASRSACVRGALVLVSLFMS
jgi:hypothetical protein